MSEYPNEDELALVQQWPFKCKHAFEDFMAYVKSIGHYWPDESFGWHQEGRIYYVSTGGWSGNESIIEAMQENWTFWMVCWQEHRRGGHYIFEVPDPAIYFKKGQP